MGESQADRLVAKRLWALLALAAELVVGHASAAASQTATKSAQPPAASNYRIDGGLTTQVVAGPVWAKKMPVYEVNLDEYHFAPGAAFREFEMQLPVLKEMGIGIIWLMPIFPRGHKRAFGSPYSVQDYRAVNPAFGTLEDFQHLLRRAHALGLRVILDWVPNHTSWDNPLIQEHPEFYVKDAEGNISQAGPWSDVAQLDYHNRALWDTMRDNLIYWVRDIGIDGYRMDTAGRIPAEFWTWLRPQLDKIRPVFMLAEDDSPRDHPAFDCSYDWRLPPVLWQIAAGSSPATAIDDLLQREVARFPRGAIRMRFLDNHDFHNTPDPGVYTGELGKTIPRMDGETVLIRYRGGVQAMMALCAMLPGKPLLYNGQEMGNGKLDPPRNAEERKSSPVWDFYRRLYGFYQRHPAVYEGEFVKLPTSRDTQIYAFARQSAADRVVVVLNLSDHPETFDVMLGGLAGRYRELFTDTRTTLARRQTLTLGPWGYLIYSRV